MSINELKYLIRVVQLDVNATNASTEDFRYKVGVLLELREMLKKAEKELRDVQPC